MTDIRKRVGRKGVTYQVRFRGAKGYEYRTFETLKEARGFREDSKAKRRAGRSHSEIVTVFQAVDKWLEICEKEGRHGREPVTKYTLENYEYRADIIKSYEWTKKLTELERADLIEFRSWLLKRHSREVAHKALTSLHSAFDEMVSREILPDNVAADIRVGSSSRYDETVAIPSEAEIRELLAAADRLANSRNEVYSKAWQRYRPMLYLAVDSGMRPQEYLALPRSNVKERGVAVDRALEGSGTEITVTKTRAGRRFIDLNTETLEMVRHYANHHAGENKWDLVFPADGGGWQSRRNWQRRGFARACEEAGLGVEKKNKRGETVFEPKYTPYDLRHFYASILIDQRVNLKRIQTLMGHRDIKTTLNVYGHLIERVEAQAENRISALGYLRPAPACGESVAQTA
jgi:integrase